MNSGFELFFSRVPVIFCLFVAGRFYVVREWFFVYVCLFVLLLVFCFVLVNAT